jgi:hypothetical protein
MEIIEFTIERNIGIRIIVQVNIFIQHVILIGEIQFRHIVKYFTVGWHIIHRYIGRGEGEWGREGVGKGGTTNIVSGKYIDLMYYYRFQYP